MTFVKRSGLLLALAMLLAIGLRAQTAGNDATHETKTYADTREGIEQQFADILEAKRSENEEAFEEAEDRLKTPNLKEWMAAHFDAEDREPQEELYLQAFSRYITYLTSVMGFGKSPEFALKVEESQLGLPLAEEGFEGLIPRPKDKVKVENFRFTSTTGQPPSWVTSFIYLDGQFHMIGGTYPYWAEVRNAAHGPMTLPPRVMHGRTVQAQANRDDTTGRGLDGVVHIRVNLDENGKLIRMEVLSGEPEFLADAMQYIQEAEFPKFGFPGLVILAQQGGGPASSGPTFAPPVQPPKEWDMEVAFFTPKQTAGTQRQ